MNTIVIKVR